MSKRPLIGIAPSLMVGSWGRPMYSSYEAYVQAIRMAGGASVILTPERSELPRYLRMIDGLLLTGGDDVHPKFFGEDRRVKSLKLSPDRRTLFELDAIRSFRGAKKPILGVCLGCQTIGVAYGAKLIQDIPTEWPKAANHRKGKHPVFIDGSSLLRKIVGKDRLLVNTYHHQALRGPGRGLRVTAVSHDDIIEAVEAKGGGFLVGVQWHPEAMLKTSSSKKLFRAFINACRGSRAVGSRRRPGS